MWADEARMKTSERVIRHVCLPEW